MKAWWLVLVLVVPLLVLCSVVGLLMNSVAGGLFSCVRYLWSSALLVGNNICENKMCDLKEFNKCFLIKDKIKIKNMVRRFITVFEI